MGRKRKSESEVKVTFSLTIKRELIEKLKEQSEKPSELISQLVEEYLKKIEKL